VRKVKYGIDKGLCDIIVRKLIKEKEIENKG
jgi:hypothetical protein